MNRPVQSRQSENADPHEQYNPIPRIVILVILALLAWAVYYIVSAQPNSSPRLGGSASFGGSGSCAWQCICGWQAAICQCLCGVSSGDGARFARGVPAFGGFRVGEG